MTDAVPEIRPRGRGRNAPLTAIATGRLVRDIWLSPHRPFFALSALWAVLAVMWWRFGDRIGLPVPALGTTTLWHAHEMTVGVGGAAMAAYFLTAMPNWTGARRVTGRGLMLLAGLWALARLAAALGQVLPLALVLAPGLAFYALFTLVYLRAVVSGRRGDRWAIPAAIAFLGLADAAFLATALGYLSSPGDAAMTRVLVLFFAIKVSIIAGNMAPALIAGWVGRQGKALPRIDPLASRIGLGLMLAALALTLGGAVTAGSTLLIAAGAAQLWRMRHWHGLSALGYAPALMLVLAFAWAPLGLALTGLAALVPLPWREADAIHVLMMGAMSGLAFSIAARAAARREGGLLRIGPLHKTGFALLWGAVWLRLAAPAMPSLYEPLLDATAAAFCAGWALFLAGYLPSLRGAVINPVFNVGGHGHGHGHGLGHGKGHGQGCGCGGHGGGGGHGQHGGPGRGGGPFRMPEPS
ncbi:uncharacterized protein involved in response to NO [Rhodovulum sulfidophilum]|uniref:NnrS family protein n=1 Tax=Rhodovulum sulfidophilum TaxID=35806 RepID=UPI0006977A42|nr:NnrS family protein [Rhodovulum sulfidophilum]ANB34350.1 hypothetical protein A6W98_09835 [Rhodovulum sulfidophilum DSM 1374]ANB38173.1 hypothetical protein A6024_09695 [Rhodovulum sulfidophilum]MCW2301942.1 uncharacterized protein involved in response to NO [Rhodovulum sulfidophilum]